MKPEGTEKEVERNTGVGYLRGLNAAVRNNASAYGYSVTITATFGILSAIGGSPRVAEIFAFAGGAVFAFALVEAVISRGFRRGAEDEPTRAKMLGSSISVFSVGSALLCGLAAGLLTDGFAIWPLGSFLATGVYLFAFALELSVAERLQSKRQRK